MTHIPTCVTTLTDNGIENVPRPHFPLSLGSWCFLLLILPFMNLKVKSCGVCSFMSGFMCRIRLCGYVYGCVTRRVWMCESVTRSFLSLSGFSAECAHQFVDSFTWWGCFQFVVMLNEVTVNILVQTFVWTVISSTDSVFGVIWKVAPCARSFKLSSRSFGRLRSALRSLGRSAVALWGRPRLDPLWRGCPAAAAAFVAAFFRCSAFAPLLSAGWPHAVVKRRLAACGC